MKIKTALSPSRLPGLDYALNPYRGCRHACVYCYSPDVLRLDDCLTWGSFSEPKENIPVVLAGELKRKKPGVIGMGTVTDPYQPAEAKHRLSRYCLEQIARKPGWRVTVQTKSDLVARDIDVIGKIRGAEVIFTVTTCDASLTADTEPGAPPPEKRVAALREVSSAGIDAWVFLGPIMPGLNDSPGSLAAVVEAAADAGAGKVMYDKLRPRRCVSRRGDGFFSRGCEDWQTLAASGDWYDAVSSAVEAACADAGVECVRAF